jgi:hypothetical protein
VRTSTSPAATLARRQGRPSSSRGATRSATPRSSWTAGPSHLRRMLRCLAHSCGPTENEGMEKGWQNNLVKTTLELAYKGLPVQHGRPDPSVIRVVEAGASVSYISCGARQTGCTLVNRVLLIPALQAHKAHSEIKASQGRWSIQSIGACTSKAGRSSQARPTDPSPHPIGQWWAEALAPGRPRCLPPDLPPTSDS